jgi:nitroreductase
MDRSLIPEQTCLTKEDPVAWCSPSAGNDWPTMAAELIHARRTVLPKRLVSPGPNTEQQHSILAAASAAPDHGQLLPWRFIVVPQAQRVALGEVFAQSLLERDARATPAQLAQARDKAQRSPWLMLVVVNALRGDPGIDLAERIVSAGCAVQNMLLMATAQGWGSALTSGKALKAGSLRDLFALQDGELALCFLSIGTALSPRAPRTRPSIADYVSTLGDARVGH